VDTIGLVVSPNPTNGEFAISTVDYFGKVTIEVLDITGKSDFHINKRSEF
jgi:hypothetical protein